MTPGSIEGMEKKNYKRLFVSLFLIKRERRATKLIVEEGGAKLKWDA